MTFHTSEKVFFCGLLFVKEHHLWSRRCVGERESKVDGSRRLPHSSLPTRHHHHASHPLDHLPLGQTSRHQRLLSFPQLLILPPSLRQPKVQLSLCETKQTLLLVPLKQKNWSQHLTACRSFVFCPGSQFPGRPSKTGLSTRCQALDHLLAPLLLVVVLLQAHLQLKL